MPRKGQTDQTSGPAHTRAQGRHHCGVPCFHLTFVLLFDLAFISLFAGSHRYLQIKLPLDNSKYDEVLWKERHNLSSANAMPGFSSFPYIFID